MNARRRLALVAGIALLALFLAIVVLAGLGHVQEAMGLFGIVFLIAVGAGLAQGQRKREP